MEKDLDKKAEGDKKKYEASLEAKDRDITDEKLAHNKTIAAEKASYEKKIKELQDKNAAKLKKEQETHLKKVKEMDEKASKKEKDHLTAIADLTNLKDKELEQLGA